MTKTIEKLEATAQLDRAAAALGDALAKVQDISQVKGSTVRQEEMVESLAKCLQHVFALKSVGLVSKESRDHIRSAMARLRSTLTLLQTITSDDPAMGDTLRMTARSLAVLYPVSMLIEQLSQSESMPRRTGTPSSSPAFEGGVSRDRRSTLRQSVEVDIGLHSGTNFFTGFSEDISSGGLFLSTYDMLPIGAKVNVNFSLPAGPILSVNGVVRWVRELNEMTPEMMPGMGIQFESLSAEEAELINRYMSDIPPMFYE
jgi:uncharacterized protein (TIGR02266 family)